MKVLLLGLLALSSFSALANIRKLSYCPKLTNQISLGQGHELINRAAKKAGVISSRIVCFHNQYGNFLFDNASNKSYEIASDDACYLIEQSIRKNTDSSFTFIVDDATGLVLSVNKIAKIQCSTTQLDL